MVGADQPMRALSALYKKPFRITKRNNSKSICLVDMNMFARFDKIQAMTLQDIKETKRYS